MSQDSSQLLEQGIAALQKRDTRVAADCFSRVLDTEPDNVDALHAMASLYHAQGDTENAIRTLEKLIGLRPADAAAHNNLGILYQAVGESKKSRECYRNAISARRMFPEAWTNLGASLLMDNMYEKAHKCLEAALEMAPGYPDAHFNLGKLHQARGDVEKAKRCMRETLKIQPAYAPAIAVLATLLDDGRDTQQALDLLDQARVAGHVSPEVALVYARISGKQGNTASAKELAATVAEAPQLPGHVRAEAEFVMGELCDRAHEWDEAVAHYQRGNQMKPKRFDMTAHREYVASLIEGFTKSTISHLAVSGFSSDAPVFVLGLPRSGKSCVEQVLSSHPEISGLGEFGLIKQTEHRMRKDIDAIDNSDVKFSSALEPGMLDQYATDYLAQAERVGGAATRYIDSMPTNYMRLPLIGQLFPNARIIECVRRKDDNALYCFFKNFSAADMSFATDIADIREYFDQYQRLIDHWKSVLELPWIEANYEELMDDTESVAHRLIKFLGLEWNASCLDYAQPGVARLAEPPAVRTELDAREIGHAEYYSDLLDLPAPRA